MKISRETASKDLLFFREATGITQDQLSIKTGVSVNTILSIEKDSGKKIRALTLFKLNQYIEKIG